MRSPFRPFPWKTLRAGQPLRKEERDALDAAMRGLLTFQRTLARWRTPALAPDATPFVSLYASGVLRGCYGSDEGTPGERLARAFLLAASDSRFGGLRPSEREHLVAQVSYVRRAVLVNPETAAEQIELGVHGVAVAPERGASVLLLPHVARDERIDGKQLLASLSRKAGLGEDGLGEQALYLFETQDVVVRPERAPPQDTGIPAALRWLTTLVGPDGRVTFSVDPRARTRASLGVMHHGRASVVAQALSIRSASRDERRLADRVKERLAADARASLAGDLAPGWPEDPAQIAGSLALMARAGVPVRPELERFLASHDITASPWHCAQVVAAIGQGAPEGLWRACVADLAAHPWAPWTLLAADALEEHGVRERAARALCEGLRAEEPHRGAGSTTAVPEVALTALAVEALSVHRTPQSRAARRRARSFIGRSQLVGDRVYGALDPSMAWGAFPASPVIDYLRGDVTGHAVLALQ
jgi:AMMECR1 domain-containing protein